MTGFGGQQARARCERPVTASSLVKRRRLRAGLPPSSSGGQRSVQPRSLGGSGLVAALGSLLLPCPGGCCTTSRSARISSKSMASMSRMGSTLSGLVDVLDHMDDVVIVEAAHNMDDGVGARGCWPRNLLPRPSPLDGTLDQTGDVHELDRRQGWFSWADRSRRSLSSRSSGTGTMPHVGVNGAEGVVGRLRRPACW